MQLAKLNPIEWGLMKVTKYLRYKNAIKYVPPRARSHLDIGSDDGSFLKKAGCNLQVGLDSRNGVIVTDKLNLESDTFDCISMLAFLEHIDYPEEIILESCRILNEGGVLIITTPLKKAESLIRIYAPSKCKQHKQNFTSEQLEDVLKKAGFMIIENKKFALGYNQIIVGVKK